MATLEFPHKASISQKHGNFWDINARYALEVECIHQHLEDQAAILWKEDKPKKAIDAFANIKQQIESHYIGEVDGSQKSVAVSSIIKEKTKDGTLKKECPTMGTIITLSLALAFTVSIEFSVLLVQSLSDNPFIIVFALVLAAGGVCQGVGAGNYYYNGWLEETRRKDNDKKKYLPFIIAGSIFILLVAGIRGFFGGVIIFLTTLVLGLLVCIAETFLKYLNARRKQCLHDLEQAQKEYASEMHRVAVNKGKYFEYFDSVLKQYDTDGSTNGKVAQLFPGGAV